MSDRCPRPRECAECPLWWWGVTIIILVILFVIAFGLSDLSAQTQTVTGDRLRLGPTTVPAGAVEIRVGDDGSNYCDIAVSGTGQLTLDCLGTGASYLFYDTLDLRGTLSNGGGSVTIDDPLVVTGTSDLRGNIFNNNSTVIVDDALGVTGAVDLLGSVSNSGAANGGAVYVNDLFTVTNISDLRNYIQNTSSNNSGAIFLNDPDGVQVSNALYVGGAMDVRGTISNTTASPLTLGDAVVITGTIDAQNALANSTSNNSYKVLINDAEGVTITGPLDLQSTITNSTAANGGAVYVGDGLTVMNDFDVRGTTGIINGGSNNGGDVLIGENIDIQGTLDVRAGNITNSSAVGTTGLQITTQLGDLELAPAANIITDPDSTFVLPGSNYTDNLGSPFAKYLSIYAAELNIDTLISREKIATTGGWLMVTPSTELIASVAPDATSIQTKHNNLALNDVLHLEARGQVEFMRVAGAGVDTLATATYQSATADTPGSFTQATWIQNVPAATNTLLLVGVSLVPNAGQTVTTVSTTGPDGVARYLSRVTAVANSTTARAELWYLVAPPEGSNTITVNLSAAAGVVGGSLVLSGIDQRTPLRTYLTATGTSATMAINFTGLSIGDVGVAVFANSTGGTNCTAVNTEVVRYTAVYSTTMRGCGVTEPVTSAGAWTTSVTGGATAWAAVGAALIPATLYTTYSVTRDLDTTGANQWLAGDAIHNLGGATSNDGWIELYAERSQRSGSEFGPTIVVNHRNSTTYNDWTVRAAMGHLNGLYGKGSNVFGFAAGDPANANITVEDSTGIQFRDSTTVKGQISNDGTWWFGDYGTTNNGYIRWDGAALNVKGSITVTAGSNVAAADLSNVAAAGATIDAVPNGTTYQRTTANQVTGAGRAYNALNSASNLITAVAPGVAAPVSGSGLYLGANYMGFYDGSAGQSSTLNTYLVGYWDLDETGTNPRNDSKNTSHFGTIFASATHTTGLIGNAFSSGTQCGYYARGTSTSDTQTGDVNFTVAFWLKRSNTSYFSGHVYYLEKGTEYRIGIENESTHAPRICIGAWSTSDSAPSNCLDAPTGINETSNWHLIVAGYDTDNNNIFISLDGANRTNKSYATAPTAGSSVMALAECGPGYYDELGMWKSASGTAGAGALSNTQITELYNAGAGITWDGTKFPDIAGGGVFKTYTDSSGNFYLGGSSGVLQWNASTSTLKLGDASNEHLELSGSVTKWNNGSTTMASLGGSPSTLTLGEDAANKTRLTIDSTNGFKVIRDSGGTDATAFHIDNSGYIWLSAANHSTDYADTSQIKWSVPAVNGSANIATRYYDSTDDVVSLRLFAGAASAGSADIGQVQLATQAGTKTGQITLASTEGGASLLQFIGDYLELSGTATGAAIRDFWDGYVNIADGMELTGAIRERNRTAMAIGEWTAVAYNDANFYASNGDNWTVASGDQVLFAYTLVGTTMMVAFQIDTSTVANAPPYLMLDVPNGGTDADTIARSTVMPIRTKCSATSGPNNDGWRHGGYAWAVATEQTIRLYMDSGPASWCNTTDLAGVQGQIAFEVN